MSEEPGRFRVLREIADYIVQGPSALSFSRRESPSAQEGWLESFLRMSEIRRARDTLHARALYIAPNYMAPADHLPAVREVKWNRREDRRRCSEGIVYWPDVSVAYYEIQPDELPPLEALVNKLDVALTKIPPAGEGLNLGSLYPADRAKFLQERSQPVPVTPETRFYNDPVNRKLFRGTTVSIWLSWPTNVLPEVDEPWLEVWEKLGTFCRDDRRVSEYKETYLIIEPKQYAELLTKALE